MSIAEPSFDRASVEDQVFAVVLDHIPENGHFIAAEIVDEVLAHLESERPLLLRAFERRQARNTLRAFATSHLNLPRKTFYGHINAARFERTMAEYDRTGDASVFDNVFQTQFTVNKRHERKPVGDMTRPECKFVADEYRSTAERAAFRAVLWDTIAARIPMGLTVKDVFTEAQFVTLMHELGLDDNN